jgi:hypothetical protein
MRKGISTTIYAVFAVMIVGFVGWNSYQTHSLSKRIEALRWSVVYDELNRQDAITPQVGIIQFFKGNAFSITLEKVDYTANGLHITGKIGNATNLYINNLALTFTATKQLYEMKDDFDKASEIDKDFFEFTGSPPIGNAQSTAIAALSPGAQQDFDVTIPNVRQTKSAARIAIAFSGERYSYAP